MILTGKAITENVVNCQITIEPYNKEHVTTNSYDLTLGNQFIRYTGEILDPRIDNEYEIIECDEQGIVLKQGDFLLGHSCEKIGSQNYVPIIHAKSGIARLGLFVHITADLIDIGSFGCVTFQLYSTLPIRIFPGMKVGQVSFWKPLGDITLYDGKYQGSKGPAPSKVHRDFIA